MKISLLQVLVYLYITGSTSLITGVYLSIFVLLMREYKKIDSNQIGELDNAMNKDSLKY